MYSQFNSLKVLVSPLLEPTNIANVKDLQEGELGFFNKTSGDIIADGIGTGYFALKKNGVVVKSDILTFVGYASALKSYTAPTNKSATITVPSATPGQMYQLKVQIKIPGLRGYIYVYGNHVAAASGDTTSTIATALVTSINSQLAREGKSGYLTVTSLNAVITIQSAILPYVKGHKPARMVDFKAFLSFPTDESAIETITVLPSWGVGYGPQLVEMEYFAQGDSDQHRLIEWRNNFDPQTNAVVSGKYDVAYIKADLERKTANARIDAPQEYIIAFNTIGQTNAPVIDAAVNGDTAVTGVSFAGATVVLSVDGSPETGVVANGSGVWSVTVTVATGEVLTATAVIAGATESIASNPVTVTAT